jgi:Mrp family chromosome partitioning ATPase/capsular polysaccharide biosynthesis protein
LTDIGTDIGPDIDRGPRRSLQTYFNRIWRYRWLVLVITVITTLGALVYTVWQPTTYTARSTLTTASENRSPDQDAYLAEGFAQYFNKESYQERIRVIAQVPEDVEVSAFTGATSPILYIEATGPDPAVASRVAAQVAERFPDDVQDIAHDSRNEEIARIEQRIKDNLALLTQLTGDSDRRALILSEIDDLQRQANDLRDNTTNQLINLQTDAGVSADLPSPILNGLLGFAGGLALGCAVALALAALRNRITTPDDVRGLLGLPTLVVLNGGRRHDDQARAQRLESLAAVVSLSDLPQPAALAITAPQRTSLTSHVAEGIVYYQALQGTRTLLVRADLRSADTEPTSHEATVAGLLAGTSARPPAPMEMAIGTAEMLVVPAGLPLTTNPFALFAPARFDALLRDLSGLADLIVIEAPPVNEAAESQIICAAADQTVLVVEEGMTRGSDGSRACELLTQVGASVLGAVLGHPVQKNGHAEPFSTLPFANMVRRPVPTQSPDLTVPVPELLVEGGGASEEASSPRARVNSPRASTDGIDSAPPVALAESALAAVPASASAPTDAMDPPQGRVAKTPRMRTVKKAVAIAAKAPSDEVAAPFMGPEEAAPTPEDALLVDADVVAEAALAEKPEAAALEAPSLEEQPKEPAPTEPAYEGPAHEGPAIEESAPHAAGLPTTAGETATGAKVASVEAEQPIRSEMGPSPSAEDHGGGQDDEGPDTVPVAAQAPVVEEARDQPTAPTKRDPTLQPQPAHGALPGEYLLYSDTQLTTPPAGTEPFDPRDPKLFALHQASAAQAAVPPPVAPDLDAPPTLTSATPMVPALHVWAVSGRRR